MSEHVFALDIGTQTVTGIILEKIEQSFVVSDFYTEQHKERAMLDGQIQDVVQVAEVIKRVKRRVEEQNGPLERVCVAAAGRALKTIQTAYTFPIHERPITSTEQIKHIELSAVQEAQIQLAEQMKGSFSDYYCVGYSVVHYKLDDEIIGSFIDQTGNEVTVEVIATFLPKVVIESLMAALNRTYLKMDALTLEPIAAIHVLIPESMRKLNVALIDIGAGTSDLAISNDGTIVAYGMVPVAGDEITEKIGDHFLLDFKDAEWLKRKVIEEKIATVHDILGFEINVTLDDLLTTIESSVDHLATLLANKVLELNKQSPQAVMLVGGGSLTPMIEEKLAANLKLPNNRVAVRGSDAIQYINNKESIPSGPDFVTPVGIAISATENPFQYMNVSINDKNAFLFTMDKLTIGNCFIQAGIDIHEYYGKIGLAYFVTINGEQITIPGFYGSEPTITLNGRRTTVDNFVQENDQINITKGKDGQSPTVTISDVVGNISPLHCYFNNELVTVQPTYRVNGKKVNSNYVLKDNDDIVAKVPETIAEFLESIRVNYDENAHFHLFIDERRVDFPEANGSILLNDINVSLATPIHNESRINTIPTKPVTLKTILQKLELVEYNQIVVSFNDEPITLKQRVVYIKRNGETLTYDDTLHVNDHLHIEHLEQRDFIFQDVFRYVDIDVSSIGGNYRILCNDEHVNFRHVIHEGDRLSLKS